MCGLKFRLVRRSGTIGGEDTLTDMNRQSLSFRLFRVNPPFPPCESNFVPSISPPHTSQCHRPTWTTECAPMPSLPRPLCNSFFHAVQPLMFSMDRKPKNTPEKVGSTRQGNNQWSTASWGHCGGVHVLQVLRQGNPWDFQVFVGAHSFFFVL